jgi:small subunit ribosomal protein S16
MVKLRLARHGAKKRPFYRIVAVDERSPRDGRFLEQLGYFDPKTDPPNVKVDLDRADYWIGHGAAPSPTVATLLKKARLTPADA